MAQKKSNYYLKLGLAISWGIGGAIAFGNATLAQIVPDQTLGNDSSVINNVVIDGIPSNQIEGGVKRETNLFHSFQEFNVGEGQRVDFANPPGVNNILTRVTGDSRSEILGQLGVSGNANLFLINPNGIIFGPNASLNLKGSFLTSTASSVIFNDGTQFSATDPQTPLLKVSVPIGLQFGEMAADIQLQRANLAVQPDKTLGLLGGNVTLEGGSLTASGGRIELGSVAPSSLVSMNPAVQGWDLGYEGVQSFQNILLKFDEFAPQVNTSGEGAGDIQVQGRQVKLADSSQIASINQGTDPGGNVTINASESVELLNGSGISTETTSAGNAGNTIINTKKFLLNQALVSTQSSRLAQGSEPLTLATGRGGNLTVNASESVELNGSLMSSVTLGSGTAGNITINTGNLIVRNQSEVSASTDGEGQGGNLTVTADSINLDTGGKLIATSKFGRGGGNITLRNLDLLQMRRNSSISTNAEGSGMGGDISINTELLVALENSDITANATGGLGGQVLINAQKILGTEGREQENEATSDITATSDLGPQFSGTVEINMLDVELNSGLIILPAQLVDVTKLIALGCSATGGNVARASKFIATGRGGLPPNPTEALRSDTALADLGTPVKIGGDRLSANISTNSVTPTPLVEAQGWAIGSKGEVVLTAQASAISSIPWLTPNTCNG